MTDLFWNNRSSRRLLRSGIMDVSDDTGSTAVFPTILFPGTSQDVTDHILEVGESTRRLTIVLVDGTGATVSPESDPVVRHDWVVGTIIMLIFVASWHYIQPSSLFLTTSSFCSSRSVG